MYTRCDNASFANFVTAISRTNSNWFEFVRLIAATKFCRSDNDFHEINRVTQGELLRRLVPATCRSDLSPSVSRLTRQRKNGTGPIKSGTVPLRYGTIGAYGPVAERIKVHCFFTKMIGTVPLFIGPVPFFLKLTYHDFTARNSTIRTTRN